jgi:predicted O-methyltransferase YrrM
MHGDPKNYSISSSIPGWTDYEILSQLAKYASMVPTNGNILELGALFGRSTYALGHNKPHSVGLYVVELWPTIYMKNHTEVNYHDGKCGDESMAILNSSIKHHPDRIDGNDTYQLWLRWTHGITNLHAIKGRTTISHDLLPQFDLIFHDAGHTYEDVYTDLNHWYIKLKDNGIIIIDDYDSIVFPGLCKAVDKFVDERHLQTKMITGRNILLQK